MSDFRDRFGWQLATASAGLVAVSESDFRVRLGIQLTRAAGELAAARRPLAAPSRRERALRLPRGSVPRISRPIAVGLSLTAFAGAATAGVIWLPQLGDSRFGEHPPTISATAPPPDQLAALAVLRRPQTAADQNGALTTGALRAINSYTTGVRTNYIRVLAGGGSSGFVLVPVAQRLGSGVTPDGRPASAATPDALCLYATESAAAGVVFVNCYTLAQILAPTPPKLAFGDQLVGLAPDGVATATITFANGAKLSAPVHNNLYDVTLSTSGPPISPTVTFSSGH
jgi:hypothetical protein